MILRNRTRPKAYTPIVTYLLLTVFLLIALRRLPITANWMAWIPEMAPSWNAGWEHLQTSYAAVRMTAHIFVHRDAIHLFGNLVFLLLFGIKVEQRIGHLATAVLFIGAGLTAYTAEEFLTAVPLTHVLGSSGAISGILGCYLGLFSASRIGLILPLGLYWRVISVPSLTIILAWFLLQLFFGYSDPISQGIAWRTHVFGFLFGLVFGLIANPFARRP